MNHTTQHVPLKEDIDRYFAHEVLPRSGYGLSSGTLADSLRSPRRRGVNVDVVSIGQSLQTLDVSWLRQDAQSTPPLQCGQFSLRASDLSSETTEFRHTHDA